MKTTTKKTTDNKRQQQVFADSSSFWAKIVRMFELGASALGGMMVLLFAGIGVLLMGLTRLFTVSGGDRLKVSSLGLGGGVPRADGHLNTEPKSLQSATALANLNNTRAKFKALEDARITDRRTREAGAKTPVFSMDMSSFGGDEKVSSDLDSFPPNHVAMQVEEDEKTTRGWWGETMMKAAMHRVCMDIRDELGIAKNSSEQFLCTAKTSANKPQVISTRDMIVCDKSNAVRDDATGLGANDSTIDPALSARMQQALVAGQVIPFCVNTGSHWSAAIVRQRKEGAGLDVDVFEPFASQSTQNQVVAVLSNTLPVAFPQYAADGLHFRCNKEKVQNNGVDCGPLSAAYLQTALRQDALMKKTSMVMRDADGSAEVVGDQDGLLTVDQLVAQMKQEAQPQGGGFDVERFAADFRADQVGKLADSVQQYSAVIQSALDQRTWLHANNAVAIESGHGGINHAGSEAYDQYPSLERKCKDEEMDAETNAAIRKSLAATDALDGNKNIEKLIESDDSMGLRPQGVGA